MNCGACQELLQRRLDGELPADDAGLREHLAACPECRQLHRAARRLEEGLRRLPPPEPPAGLAGRIARRVLAEQGLGRRRLARFRPVAALAASLLLIFLLSRGLPTSGPPTAPPPALPSASLRDSVAEAGSAVTSLTRRTADETVGQGRLLLPVLASPGPLPEPSPGPLLPPPVGSLREAGDEVSASLEPVTASARRAFDLFLREVPGMAPRDKQPEGS